MIDDLGISKLTDEETLAYLQQLQRERSRLEARMTRTMAHFHELRRPIANAKYAADEIAAALSWSTYTTSGVLGTAVALMERLPDTVTAVEQGQLDMTKARAILEWTETLSPEQARQVAEQVHEWSVGRTAPALRQKLAREVAKVDPDAIEARRQQRTRERKVGFYPNPDGMATLAICAPADRVRALYQLLDHVARQAKAAGDPRTLEALRTDVLFEILLGPNCKRVQVELRVTVPASVLAGVSSDPGWLHGYGPITSQAVWELAQQSEFWRRVITDPATGAVVEVSRRYPTAGLREYVNTRTRTCVGVGCSRPAESCDTDHTVDYAKGGQRSDRKSVV